MIALYTVLIEHKIFNPKKRTTKVAISKLWLVYCISSMQMHLLFTGQILQSKLRVKATKLVLLSIISLVMLSYQLFQIFRAIYRL